MLADNVPTSVSVVVTYTLIKPLVAFSHRTQQVATLPIGAAIELVDRPRREGVVEVACEGEHYFVFRQDIESSTDL